MFYIFICVETLIKKKLKCNKFNDILKISKFQDEIKKMSQSAKNHPICVCPSEPEANCATHYTPFRKNGTDSNHVIFACCTVQYMVMFVVSAKRLNTVT